MTTRFLLDANLSPLTREYLAATIGFDVVDLLSSGRHGLRDAAVVALAKEQGRVVITFDLDLGEIYHRYERGTLGVIMLRLEDQTVESVNDVLDRFFRTQAQTIALDRSLVVLEAHRVRIVSEP
jgi:predicted nuclease of predicted toxin-antitoxin system